MSPPLLRIEVLHEDGSKHVYLAVALSIAPHALDTHVGVRGYGDDGVYVTAEPGDPS